MTALPPMPMSPMPMPHIPLPHIARSERLLVVVGPSGAGKDSVLHAWRAQLKGHDVHFAQRVITRPPETQEAPEKNQGGEAHESVDTATFQALCKRHELATWWQAHGLSYGVRWSELAALARGGWVVMNGSRAQLPALRQQAPQLHAVEITAPPAVRAQRLAARGREDAAAVAQRLARSVTAQAASPRSLQVDNQGLLSVTVSALHTWWCRIAREALPPG